MDPAPRPVRIPDGLPLSGPMYRAMLALDLEKSTHRTDMEKALLRKVLYSVLDDALEATGITGEQLDQSDRGDGAIVLVRPDDNVPMPVLLTRLMPVLTQLLMKYNASIVKPEPEIRMRAVIHAGYVLYDGRGFFGQALDVTCRLLDSPQLKKILRETSSSPLVLAVSPEVYSSIICQYHLDPGAYTHFRFRKAGIVWHGWARPGLEDHPGLIGMMAVSRCGYCRAV